MQKQGIDALKRMAQMAKNRLRNKVVEKENKNFSSKRNFKIIYNSSSDIKCKIITKEDKKLYDKVKEMLDNNFDVVNPIAKLIDYKIFNKMDDLAQERYLFDVIEKYKKYKEKYVLEKLEKIG